MDNYIFKSQRLGFRNWQKADLSALAAINADREVMEFFPAIPGEKESLDFIWRMQKQYDTKGFCYFAVEKLDKGEFIGFIGLSEQTFEAEFTPCIDIGWRLKRSEWNKGYATEGANACLDFAFRQLKLRNVVAIAPQVNIKSELIMKKIGMRRLKAFEHPLLTDYPRLRRCLIYEKSNPALKS